MPIKQKQEYLIVTFPNVTEAMRLESACAKKGLPGRLIPIPKQISATCGMAWRSDPKYTDALKELGENAQISIEDFCSIEL